jgi:hypothetical protein
MSNAHATRMVRPWCDWLLLAVGLVGLTVPLDLYADAVYRHDRSVFYWLLMVYTYPEGTPAATVVGLVALALALLTVWIGLRLLARASLRPSQALTAEALAAVAGGSATLTLLLAYVASNTGPFVIVPILVAGGLLTTAAGLGLRAVLRRAGVSLVTRPVRRAWLRTDLLPVMLAFAATMIVLTVVPFALAIGERPIGFSHLATATSHTTRYHLALEQTPSDGAFAILYRCDAVGVWCRQVDALGASAGEGQSANGWLRYDPATGNITASEGGRVLLTYQVGDLFAGP